MKTNWQYFLITVVALLVLSCGVTIPTPDAPKWAEATHYIPTSHEVELPSPEAARRDVEAAVVDQKAKEWER